jgi:chemotaxis protein methyltransferase CheR
MVVPAVASRVTCEEMMVSVDEVETQAEEINHLLVMIYELTGRDFREYAVRPLYRRIARFLSEENLGTVESLRVKILSTPQALEDLLATLTIDFTSMFRDAGFFQTFRRQVIALLHERPFIRIWHAGCSTGEEVYSLAILLTEQKLYEKTRIYATDINPILLEKARQGIFPIGRMKEFTRNYLSSGGEHPFSDYYSARYNRAILHPGLQKNIIWAQHNLTCDGKFNDFDVILCRNVLIYFNQDLKNRVHTLFYRSLEPSGILGLGSHETIHFSPFEKEYSALDKSAKIYIKKGLVELAE